jgi:hypothetical protein
MRTFLFLRDATAVGLIAITLTASAAAPLPVISGRSYISGSAKVKVTGDFQVDAVIPINKQASFSDGEMTWIQYGDSGSEQPNLLVTVSAEELGFGIGLGKKVSTAGGEQCTGDMDVEATMVTGHYNCAGITSHDPRDGKMGKVTFEIDMTAGS